MPKRTDISSILVIGAGAPSLAPFRGRGKSRAAAKGEGGGCLSGGAGGNGPPLPNPSPPEGGEGLSLEVLAERQEDGAGDSFGVGHDFVVGDAQDPPAIVLESRGPSRIID